MLGTSAAGRIYLPVTLIYAIQANHAATLPMTKIACPDKWQNERAFYAYSSLRSGEHILAENPSRISAT